jgi:hypothetical protein
VSDPSKSALELRILGVLCILVLCGILVVGLWPFHHPRNEVTWLTRENGLRFDRHGTVLSPGPFVTSGPETGASGAIEMWIRPNLTSNEHTLLAFSTPEHPLQFLVRGYQSGIVLESATSNHPVQNRPAGIYIADVFHQRQPVFLTATSGIDGTSTYVNGALLKTWPFFHFSSVTFAGQLVLGTSPVGNDSWSGQLRGLAIYTQELTAGQVSRHFETWTTKGRPDLGTNEHVLALYLFDEHQGRTVHDRGRSGIDLYIPERYLILRQKFLEPPWEEFRTGWSYWKSVGINVGGFIPLGFFFCAYLTSERQESRPALVTIILGAAVSLTVEILQAYLPTRDSGMTDIITNTLGSALGVLLYNWQTPVLNKTLNRIRSAALL